MKPYALCLAALLLAGCNTGPSYEDALATLTNEKALLEKLERERAEIDADMRSRIQSNVDMVSQLRRELDKGVRQLYDIASQVSGKNAERAMDHARQLHDTNIKKIEEQEEHVRVLNRQIQADGQAAIAEIDAKIERQLELVAKAEADRDAIKR